MERVPNVLVSGTFNIIHPGHIELLQYASRYGELVVGINGDRYQRLKYGDKAMPADKRKMMLESIRFVDRVVIFDEDEPSELIRQVRPDYFVRGPDYSGVRLPEQDALDEAGAVLVIQPVEKIGSSSRLHGTGKAVVDA